MCSYVHMCGKKMNFASIKLLITYQLLFIPCFFPSFFLQNHLIFFRISNQKVSKHSFERTTRIDRSGPIECAELIQIRNELSEIYHNWIKMNLHKLI